MIFSVKRLFAAAEEDVGRVHENEDQSSRKGNEIDYLKKIERMKTVAFFLQSFSILAKKMCKDYEMKIGNSYVPLVYT